MTKICRKCIKEIPDDTTFCPYCGKKVKEENGKNKKGRNIIIMIIAILMVIICVTKISGGIDRMSDLIDEATGEEQREKRQQEIDNFNEKINEAIKKDEKYTLGKPFTFDDLEITISNEYTFKKITNKYSDYYGKDVVRVPVTIKNLKNETHNLNMFYYSWYGAQGIQLDSVTHYFDDGIDEAGNLRTGASYTKYFYFLYDGNGTYTVEFSDWSDKISININIKKS